MVAGMMTLQDLAAGGPDDERIAACTAKLGKLLTAEVDQGALSLPDSMCVVMQLAASWVAILMGPGRSPDLSDRTFVVGLADNFRDRVLDMVADADPSAAENRKN
jgi:hypothetical protein